jgi:hypothetical protein
VNEQQIYRRVTRRSLYRSRSSLSVLVLALLAVAAVFVGIESVLAALGMAPLLISPESALAVSSLLLGLIAVPGLVLVVLAIVPSRRPRHELPDTRMAVVVDDGVLAGAVKHAVLRVARVPSDRVTSSISRRSSSTRVVPTSGTPLDHAALDGSANGIIESLAPRPPVRVSVTVSENGVVGS